VIVQGPGAPAGVGAAPVGQGFNVNASDLRFILKQIKIAEQHAATSTTENPCGTLLGSGANQIPSGGVGVTLPWGLRTVSGICNNLISDQNTWGSADQIFPRMAPKDLKGAEAQTSYTQTTGIVIDSRPRVISNLIADQTASNPAAVAAAGGAPEVDERTGTFFIPNVATDVGLSAPYNSWFTLFGQFFDHGLDLVTKGGTAGSVYMPLQPSDPLYVSGSHTNFMVLTRATHNGNHEALNQTSPFIDQSQTYTSHPSHQVFLREYVSDAAGDPVTTGRLLTGPGHGMADWARVKAQAQAMLGIQLTDLDVFNIPLLATDEYGRFDRGPNGYPQMVTPGGLVEGDPAADEGRGVLVPADTFKTGHAFLDDIAHHATPGTFDSNGPTQPGGLVDRAPDGDPGTTDDRQPGTYDDEMLNAHFIAGDGRVNENIGLISVHHVFHSEHNRLSENIKEVITTTDPTQLAEWQLAPGVWNGERLFQAARFVTEMEYQHLAFEEFIRKVQPMVNLFGEGGTGYHTAINPAIPAEFAHAVYRFGHSMLNETVERVRANNTRDDIGLLEAFLNPPAFLDGYDSPEAAAGAVVRGMTRQVGNELDEFVTEALRNELLGLPLDLATLNIARARDTGVPGLNAARRHFFAVSHNPALVPYTSWVDLGFSLKHPESLVNFIAAYGTHPSITSASGVAPKRAAAQAIIDAASSVDPEVSGPAYAFLNSTSYVDVTEPVDVANNVNWESGANGVTTTGVDAIDLWVGGLAEKTMVFGGLLGPTFNYVFEKTTENLQDADRFYYLSRTAGLNLLTQLEGNSFAELIQRNTDVDSLPADSFSRPDLVFDVSKLGTTGPITDDPATDVNESVVLTRMPDGTIRYAGPLHAVFNGTSGADKLRSSEGDDTIRGNDGNDTVEGGDGADNLIGGLGDDILTDLFGDDTIKGGDGNDYISSGQGFGGDLNQGGRGNDFIVGGNDMTETFAGPGDDFVMAGDAEDTVFGDDGDDWIEGGTGPFNLLQGDNGAPFQDDPNEPGHDVLDGQGGETDFDAEGGDDIMMMGPVIQRAEGMLGFDWSIHKGDPQPADSDMRITGLLPPSVDVNRDRFDLVEGLSGWTFNDILRGDDRVTADLAVNHELNQAGIVRIAGLAAILPAAATSFSGGNIIVGGAGSDQIEGRGGDDIIDGDAWLNVQLRAPNPATPDTSDTKLVDDLAALQADVLARRINPGDITIVRTLEPGTPGDGDVAVFSGARSQYTITPISGGITVAHTGGTGIDGTDTVRNVEQLRFGGFTGTEVVSVSEASAPATAPGAPTIGTATAGNASATVTWTAPASDGRSAITGYQVDALSNGGATVATTSVGVVTTTNVTGLTNGTSYTFRVRAVNAVGASADSALSNTVTPATVPGAPTIGTAVRGNISATVNWTAPATNGGSPITGYQVDALTGGVTVVSTSPAAAGVTSLVVGGLTNGTSYTFRVRAVNAAGASANSAQSNAVTPATVPGAPTIGTATAGTNSATVNWTAPASNGGSAITGYRLDTLTGGGATVVSTTNAGLVTTATITGLTANTTYTFRVRAVNDIGQSANSAQSNAITIATTAPGAPVIGTAANGVNGGAITATANWTPPASSGGSAITGYQVFALQMSGNGGNATVLSETASVLQPSAARSLQMTLPAVGIYRFQVTAVNAIGTSVRSARSNAVNGR
jgi:Ca2+-binding RTX toxin-like protein